jgi:hypothetical protein
LSFNKNAEQNMNRFNEGKACDAVIRHIETREQSLRQDVRSPEREGHTAPVELTCIIGGHPYAFEHTAIEPFEGQIELEARAHFEPLRTAFSSRILPGEYYELHAPAGATLGLTKSQISGAISALDDWIQAEGPRLGLTPLGLKGTPVVRHADAVIPFKVDLYRYSFPTPPGGLSVVHEVNNLEDLRMRRIRRACENKLPKLALWKTLGARTILILEGVDDQLTNPIDVARLVLHAEKAVGNEPDEIYFVFSAIEPWSVWHIRVDARSFFDLINPDDRAWEVDPQTLSQLTNR